MEERHDRSLKKRFTHNLFLALIAQTISFAFSLLMSLLVPKILGVQQYAYWQLFILYSTYVGLFHFGLSDGVYLRFGGLEIDELDQGALMSQFLLMIIWQSLLCLIALPVVIYLTDNPDREYVWILTFTYLIIGNATWYWGYVFQAANRTAVHSISTIISKALYIVFVMIMFIRKPSSFKPFVLFYVISQFAALLYVLYQGRCFFQGKKVNIRKAAKETIKNIKVGIQLTISNIVSSLILGVGRIMVDKSAGISTFGLLSLSISITNFFLQFISQVSLVMFPALRQLDQRKTKQVYIFLRDSLGFLVCGILIFYVPIKHILVAWLPQYKQSMYYMIFLLPICVFDGKTQLIYNTYLKVFRKERALLYINISMLFLSFVLCGISAFIIKNITAISISMMLCIMSRSIIESVYLSRTMSINNERGLVFEIVLVALFILFNIWLSEWLAFFAYFMVYSIYLVLSREEITRIVCSAKKHINRQAVHTERWH